MTLSKIKAKLNQPPHEMTAKSFNRLVLDSLGNVVGKLASSKTEAETDVLQDLALKLMEIQEIKEPAEKLKAFEAIRHLLPDGCGCK